MRGCLSDDNCQYRGYRASRAYRAHAKRRATGKWRNFHCKWIPPNGAREIRFERAAASSVLRPRSRDPRRREESETKIVPRDRRSVIDDNKTGRGQGRGRGREGNLIFRVRGESGAQKSGNGLENKNAEPFDETISTKIDVRWINLSRIVISARKCAACLFFSSFILRKIALS